MDTLPQQDEQLHPTLAELTPAHWSSGRVGLADGATLHYTRTGGAKPPLLLLHGLQTIQASLPALHHEHFPASGHFVMYDEFERFVDTLGTFLAPYDDTGAV